MTTTIATLRGQVAALAAAAEPRPVRPYKLTTSENRQELDRLVSLVDLMSAVGLVLHRLEEWAVWQPGYQPMKTPTEPTDAMAARLVQLLAQYRGAGIADDGIEAALSDFRARLAQFEASGKPIGSWYAKFINPLAGNSAAQSTEQ